MNPNAKNLPEFKKLIERYETITIEEIEEAWSDDGEATGDYDARKELTGFGSTSTCSLCRPVMSKEHGLRCDKCVYGYKDAMLIPMPCTRDDTFEMIRAADTPELLLSAYRARAKYMRTLIEK